MQVHFWLAYDPPQVVYALHVIVAAVRFDVYGVFYIVLLGIWQSLSKQRKSKVCIYYIVLVEILITGKIENLFRKL